MAMILWAKNFYYQLKFRLNWSAFATVPARF